MTRSSPSHLTVLLAMGLGASLTYAFSVGEAVGYPAGATISKGENPVFSYAGFTLASSTTELMSAPSDQAMIITDVTLGVMNSNGESCHASFGADATTSGGRSVGHFAIGMSTLGQGVAHLSKNLAYVTGIRLNPGETLNLSFTESWRACSWTNYRVNYVFSGYYAEP